MKSSDVWSRWYVRALNKENQTTRYRNIYFFLSIDERVYREWGECVNPEDENVEIKRKLNTSSQKRWQRFDSSLYILKDSNEDVNAETLLACKLN